MNLFENIKNPQKLKLLLGAVILVTFGIVISAFIGYRRLLNQNAKLISIVERSKANISIGKVHHTATRNGKKEWTLNAVSARVMGDQKQTIVEKPSVVFFLNDGGKVYLTAKQGILETASNNMIAKGNVVVKNEQYTLKTENLFYHHRKRIIIAKAPVKIIGDMFYLKANSMVYNLNTKKTRFRGKVRGTINEAMSL
ncbi:MAG: LPS export ABC transporter periplasmic protein LptC [Desulfobacterales bacterium]